MGLTWHLGLKYFCLFDVWLTAITQSNEVICFGGAYEIDLQENNATLNRDLNELQKLLTS